MSTVLGPEHSNLGFDPDALREKYRQERDKRVRADGNDQYVEVSGRFAHFVDDPYVAPGFTRAPLTDTVQVLVIGGGFGGLLAAARIREKGVTDLRIIEAGGDFGGTWYWNRYPGAQCDIESYCYLPLLEELGYTPKEKYSYAPEIYEHSRRIAEAYDLYSAACFQTKVTQLEWDDAAACWIVTTDRDDRMMARFVVMCTGPLNRPKLPAIPGIEQFQGHTFHTSRWDYEYTGGDHSGNLHKLADKKVAVIGTGATAIQSVPYVGAHALHTYVFQRTPSSVDVRGNSPTDPEWAKTLTPGWQRQRRENFNDMLTGRPVEKDLVSDGWTAIFRDLATMLPREQVASIVRQIGAAVDASHRQGIVHRDLKPENLMYDSVNDRVRLLDFGIAAEPEQGNDQRLTRDGFFVGTLLYVAPEALSGVLVGPSADQYSLATIAYFLLTGVHPYTARSTRDMLSQLLTQPPTPLTKAVPGLVFSDDVERVVMKGLARQPADRYPGITDFASALSAALLAMPTAAAPKSGGLFGKVKGLFGSKGG